jgi:hypothetical protein
VAASSNHKMNACVSCRSGKRKCDKARPSCTNCSRWVLRKAKIEISCNLPLRLDKTCVYREDFIAQVALHDPNSPSSTIEPRVNNEETINEHPAVGYAPTNLHHEILSQVMHILVSIDNIQVMASEFFTVLHKKIPILYRPAFLENLSQLANHPNAELATLCLCMHLVLQMPSVQTSDVLMSLHTTVQSMVNRLEQAQKPSLNLLHCRIFLTFFEIGHGLHTPASISIAICAKLARILRLHTKPWQDLNANSDSIELEGKKRTWWAIVIMDRFINLLNGDAMYGTEDSVSSSPLPIEDRVWFEGPLSLVESANSTAPTIATSADTAVGQMARECQVSHLAGRVVRHIFNPLPDSSFHSEEAVQLERTLNAFFPLLPDGRLRDGSFCGALGICQRLVIARILFNLLIYAVHFLCYTSSG